MWKKQTEQISEEIYDSLISCYLFSEEQKGCLKWSRWIGELLYIDPHILMESKPRQKIIIYNVARQQQKKKHKTWSCKAR